MALSPFSSLSHLLLHSSSLIALLLPPFTAYHWSAGAYWTKVATSLEQWARFVIPLAYLLTMIWLFHVEFSDEYLKDIPS